jgi:hypothetical protein
MTMDGAIPEFNLSGRLRSIVLRQCVASLALFSKSIDETFQITFI